MLSEQLFQINFHDLSMTFQKGAAGPSSRDFCCWGLQREDSLSLAHRRLSLASPGKYGGKPLKVQRRRSRFSLLSPRLLQTYSVQQMSGGLSFQI
jgi:hypothetical protein